MKEQPTEWEETFANDMTDNRLIFNIFKQLIQLNIKKKNPNNLILKWAEELNKHFPKRKCRWPTGLRKDAQPLSIRKMQIKTIMIYYLTPLRMAIIIIKKKNPTNNKSWQRCGEKGALVHFCCACKVVQLLWKTAWRFIKKLKVELLYDTAVPLLGIYTRKKEKEKEENRNSQCSKRQLRLHNERARTSE